MSNPSPRKMPTWTVLDALQWTAGYFDTHGIDSPRLTAEILLAAVLQTTRIDLYMRHDQPLAEEERAAFRQMIRRRVSHEPVAYILGEKEFLGRSFTITPDVLIPRPETEHLVEAALERLPENDGHSRKILDLGTGSGAIVVCLAAQRPENRYFAMDRSLAALQVARKNAAAHGVARLIDFFAGSWLSPVNADCAGFDMIVSNPPYIPSARFRDLQPEVSQYEPRMALDGAGDGLFAISQILRTALDYLLPGGFLLMEIGWDQKAAAEKLCRGTGAYAPAEFVRDYGGHDRVAVLRKN
ncbi:MAG: peptide chain release factor N(5)-glutamine methyltransferase [Desulfosalsimonas sp.]|uniref:peptide chain release factor N(5)-glutamine methyltransferase n=1 Tax=Desulfosalsimonas sp. TaxID=3073848 RepID=UPI0039706A3A